MSNYLNSKAFVGNFLKMTKASIKSLAVVFPFSKVAGLQLIIFIEKDLNHECFFGNSLKYSERFFRGTHVNSCMF